MILIIDDDLAIGDALTLLLELEGFKGEVYLGSDIVEKVEQLKPELIILDIWLSGKDGREICRALKARPATAEVPVLMISASRNLAASAKYAGADDFIEKPFDMDDIMRKIRSLLKQ